MVKAVEDSLVHPGKFIYTDTHLQYFEAEFSHDMVHHTAKELLDGRIFRQVLVQQAHVEDLRRDERAAQRSRSSGPDSPKRTSKNRLGCLSASRKSFGAPPEPSRQLAPSSRSRGSTCFPILANCCARCSTPSP